MLSIKKSEINAFLDSLSALMPLYAPIDRAGGADYKAWSKGSKLSSALNTRRSAKDFFFPQTETLMEFKVEGKHYEVVDTRVEYEDFAVFGVRACDAKAFDVLDRVFIKEQPSDTYYKNRREHAVIITLACFKPASTCFCPVYGIDAVKHPGGDVECWLSDETYFFEAVTEKGRELLMKLSMLVEAEPKDLKADMAKAEERMKALPFASLDLAPFKEKSLLELFNMPIWKELSESCLGCGSCTFCCPTCQCFDIKDFNTGNGIMRFRTWDSCMYSDFTKMAAENPRHTQTERFRQRFMHKLVYYPDKYEGVYSCVGCGRCLNQCPISMNIVKVIKKTGEMKDGN
jgi:hypothetical protein